MTSNRQRLEIAESIVSGDLPDGAYFAMLSDVSGLDYEGVIDELVAREQGGRRKVHRKRPGKPADARPWAAEHHRPALAPIAAKAASLGLAVIDATAQYQTVIITGPGVRLIVYPHKTKGTGNYNLRISDEGSKNPYAALKVVRALGVYMKQDSVAKLMVRAADQIAKESK